MTSSTGADVPAAIRHLDGVYTIRELAEALSVHPTTVYRWRNGTRRPNPANFEALRDEINMRYAAENARHNLTVVGAKLASAFAALETDTERQENAELEARIKADFAARQVREEAEAEQRRGAAYARRNARRVASQRQPVRSITTQVDPFALVGEPEPALPF